MPKPRTDSNAKLVSNSSDRLDRSSPEAARAVMDSLLAKAPPRGRRAILVFLGESIAHAAANYSDRWAVSLFPDLIRLNVGWVHCVNLYSDRVTVLVRSDPRLADIVVSKERYTTAGGSRMAVVPHAHSFDSLSWMRELHHDAMAKAAIRRCQPNVREAHSPGVVEYLWKALGRTGNPPVPTYFGPSARNSMHRRKEKSIEHPSTADRPATYLFSWNPQRWNWTQRQQGLAAVTKSGHVDTAWSCGNRREMPIGSRSFLIKLGDEKPTGIIGVGETLSDPYEDKHYADPNKTARYADIRWHDLREAPLIGWAELQQPPFKGFRWGIQGSGVELPGEIAESLEQLWEQRAGVEMPALPEELPPGARFVEGAVRKVQVNAYERDPAARAACLAKYGYACSVCGVVLEDKYGQIAREFIHVHHVKPIAKIGKSYEVDPIEDLRPVCPNCHAVLHREDPPLSIEAVRKLLRR